MTLNSLKALSLFGKIRGFKSSWLVFPVMSFGKFRCAFLPFGRNSSFSSAIISWIELKAKIVRYCSAVAVKKTGLHLQNEAIQVVPPKSNEIDLVFYNN